MKSVKTNIENAQQEAETLIACNVLNRMTALGKPAAYAIGA